MEIAIAFHVDYVPDKSQTFITKTLIRLKTIFLTIRGFWKFQLFRTNNNNNNNFYLIIYNFRTVSGYVLQYFYD